jgi:Beta/Gamma crystallin
MNTGMRRTGYLLVGALLANGAAAAELTLYADDDYQGRALGVVIDERQLGVLNFDKRASSVVIENGAWVLCTGQDYSGQCITLEPGRYASLQALGINDAITSVRRRDPVTVGSFGRVDTTARSVKAPQSVSSETHSAGDIVLFAANNYGGVSQPLDQSQADLRSEALQSNATSIVIASGAWELCDDTYFRGHCVTLGPGKYPSFQEYGLTHGVASVRRTGEAPHRAEKTAGN